MPCGQRGFAMTRGNDSIVGLPPRKRELPAIARLRELLSYDPGTGILCWRISKGKRKAGAVAECKSKDGYIAIGHDRWAAHRIAWAIYYGEWPRQEIDHRDLNKSNNSIINLREANRAQNAANR